MRLAARNRFEAQRYRALMLWRKWTLWDADVPRSKEYIGIYAHDDHTASRVAHSETRAATDMQALMEAKPLDEPVVSLEALAPLKEMLADAVDQLAPRDRWIFEALYDRRISLRALAYELSMSKTHMARERDEILERLRGALSANPEIGRYLDG